MSRHDTPICDSEPITTPMSLAFITGLIICLLLALFTHSLYIEWSKRNDPNFQILSTKSRVGYILLQYLALQWSVSDFIRYDIDPKESFLPNTLGCILLTYSSPIIGGLFYTVYLYLVLLRLENLDGSYLKTSKYTLFLLRVLIFSITALQIVYLSIDGDTVCLHRYHPTDMDEELWYCELIISTNRKYVALTGVTVILVLNITMGALFARKLHQLRNCTKENPIANIQLQKIVIQNTILIAAGSISTFICYSLWAALPPSGVWLYSDLLINCCVLGLAFPHNRKWYRRLCGCCITCCSKMFDSSDFEQQPRLPTVHNMAIIAEDVVLELELGLVPQNKDEQTVIQIVPRKELNQKTASLMQKRKPLLHPVMRSPSGSLRVSDAEETETDWATSATSQTNRGSKSTRSVSGPSRGSRNSKSSLFDNNRGSTPSIFNSTGEFKSSVFSSIPELKASNSGSIREFKSSLSESHRISKSSITRFSRSSKTSKSEAHDEEHLCTEQQSVEIATSAKQTIPSDQ